MVVNWDSVTGELPKAQGRLAHAGSTRDVLDLLPAGWARAIRRASNAVSAVVCRARATRLISTPSVSQG